MDAIEYKVNEGGTYYYDDYGPNAYVFERWDGIIDERGWNAVMIFDTQTQTVYEASIHDYTNKVTYRITNQFYSNNFRDDDPSDYYVYDIIDGEEFIYYVHKIIDSYKDAGLVKITCMANGKQHEY